MADRSIPFEGAFNVRDLGGLPAGPDGVVRRGLIYRADGPLRLTPADHAALLAMRLGCVVDLRTADEAVQGSWALGDTARHHFEVIDALPDPRLTAMPVFRTPDDIAERYVFRVENGAPAFAAALTTVVRYAAERVLFHCTAGKDRTGIIAAALLTLLDVPRAEIVADYALTTPNIARKIERQDADPHPHDTPYHLYPAITRTAPAETMDGFLQRMDERYGGLVAYLAEHGFPHDDLVPAFRALMIEPVAH